MACSVGRSGGPNHRIILLTVRLPDASIAFSPFIFSDHLKSGSGIAANHSANIFPNRNPMTQGNLSFILALPKIVSRPQNWHDNIQSQRRNSGVREQLLFGFYRWRWCKTDYEVFTFRQMSSYAFVYLLQLHILHSNLCLSGCAMFREISSFIIVVSPKMH